MKVIIAGSRGWHDYWQIDRAMRENFPDCTTVICGLNKGLWQKVGDNWIQLAIGADELGRRWALLNNINVEEFPADWKNLGKRAGMIRNTEMAKAADALLLCWDGKSSGSANMLKEAETLNLKIVACLSEDELNKQSIIKSEPITYVKT